MSPLSATHWRILDALRQHGSITPRSFSHTPTIDRGDPFDRLAPRVLELREHGYVIETVMETSPRGKRYARYFLRGESTGSVAPVAGTARSAVFSGDAAGATKPVDRLFDVTAGTPFSPFEDAA